MTLSATRYREGKPEVEVTATYGPITSTVIEHHAHVRQFWAQLGHLLDDMEHEPEV